MFRTIAVVAIVAGFAIGADEKAEKATLKGSWTRDHNGATISLVFPKDGEMLIVADLGDNGVTVKCTYKLEKDGLVKATVKSSEEKGSFPAKPKDGVEFSFKIKVKGKTATVSDFEAKDLDGAKDALEGEYESKAK